MSKLRLLTALLALAAVGAVVYVRASNTSDSVLANTGTDNSATCDSCCGPVAPEPIKDAVPAALPSPYSASPASDATPAKQ